MAGFMKSAVIVLVLALIAAEGVASAAPAPNEKKSCATDSKCSNQNVVCPDACPTQGKSNKDGKACYLDCDQTCTGMCKRK